MNGKKENDVMQTQNVYFPPKDESEIKPKRIGIINFIKNIFKKDKQDKSDDQDIIYTVPKESKKEKIESSSIDAGPVYMVPKSEKEETKTKPYTNVIQYAKELRKDKENHKMLQLKYSKALKENNKNLVYEIKNELWESQSEIKMQESFLRVMIKKIQKSSLSIEEKNKLINYICGVAKIKAKEKPKHMKENTEEIMKNPIDELNDRKEKIISSKHFTNTQKKAMIRKIDDEIIELAKAEEINSKAK